MKTKTEELIDNLNTSKMSNYICTICFRQLILLSFTKVMQGNHKNTYKCTGSWVCNDCIEDTDKLDKKRFHR